MNAASAPLNPAHRLIQLYPPPATRPPHPVALGARPVSRLAPAVLCCAAAPFAAAAGDDPLPAFVETHCTDCHGEWAQEGGLRLDTLSADLADADARRVWVNVHDRLAAGEMPPPDDSELADDERAAAVAALAAAVTRADGVEARAAMRRLNRTEYGYALRDLLRTPHLDAAEGLPAEAEAFGFDHIGSALRSSPVQLSRLLEVADEALLGVAAAIGPEPQHFTVRKRFVEDGRYQSTKDRVTVGEGAGALAVILRQPNTAQTPWRLYGWTTPYRAHYRIRVRAKAATFSTPGRNAVQIPFDEKAHRSAAKRDKEAYEAQPPGETLTEPTERQVLGFYAETRRLGAFDLSGEWQDLELTAHMAPGEEFRLFVPTMDDRSGNWRKGPYTGPAVVLDQFEIEGPLAPDGTPPAWPAPGYGVLFDDLPMRTWEDGAGTIPPPAVESHAATGGKKYPRLKPVPKGLRLTVASDEPAADARRLLGRFLPLAFRRPVPEGESDRYLSLIGSRLEDGATFEEAMFTGYAAALCSPDFLLVGRRTGEPADFALAERLALFLWRSLPDRELRDLAAAGRLDDPATLVDQAERLLKDPRSDRLIGELAGQWLGLRALTDTLPDGRLYPEFNPLLEESMREETHAFLRTMLDEDLPARTLVDSDFALLNRPLAELYGVPGVEGVDLRRVPLPADGPGAVRGGVLGQAAVLKVTANGTTTSPVVRGAWVLDRLLGQPSPPPPPGVPAVEPDTRGATTMRQLLEKHRADPACAGCHAKLDPPGFALEQFDAIGGFRDRYRIYDDGKGYEEGPPVDAAGVTADGRGFDGVDAFRSLLLADERQIARNLARRLLLFALAEDPTFTDRAAVEAILDRTADTDWGFRSLVLAVVRSDAFRGR